MNVLRGFEINDGASSGCRVLLVGEQITLRELGAVLASEDGGATFRVLARFPRALDLFHILRSGTRYWVSGDTKGGAGLLLESRDHGRHWRSLPLPAGVTIVDSVARVSGVLWAGVRTRDRGLLIVSRDDGRTWRVAYRAPHGLFNAVASAGPTVVAAGYLSPAALIVVSRDGGISFQAVRIEAFTSGDAVAVSGPDRAMVGGYYTATGMIEDARAVLVSTADGGRHWQKLAIPPSERVLDVLAGPGGKAYAVLLRARGDAVISTRDGGDTWSLVRPPGARLTGIFGQVGDDLYLVGGSGLYRSRPPDP